MKSESQIRQKVKQATFRHRKRYVQEGLSCVPENCKHNKVVRLPQHTGNRASLRVCSLPDRNVVCDSTMAGVRQAQSCPVFTCKNTPEGLKKAFQEKLGLGDSSVEIGQIAKDYPDLVALLWVTGHSSLKEMLSHSEACEDVS